MVRVTGRGIAEALALSTFDVFVAEVVVIALVFLPRWVSELAIASGKAPSHREAIRVYLWSQVAIAGTIPAAAVSARLVAPGIVYPIDPVENFGRTLLVLGVPIAVSAVLYGVVLTAPPPTTVTHGSTDGRLGVTTHVPFEDRSDIRAYMNRVTAVGGMISALVVGALMLAAARG